MKKDYFLKPFKKNEKLDEIDRKKRDKVETIMGKKLSDYEWLNYNRLTLPRNKNG